MHCLRKAKRQRKKNKANRQLLQLYKNQAVQPPRMPLKLWTGVHYTADRNEWRRYGKTFGASRFGTADNSYSVQLSRMQTLLSIQQNQRLDGIPRNDIGCFDTFCARAEMRTLKAGGSDPLAGECFRWLPFTVVVKVWKLHSQYFGDAAGVSPESWSLVPHAGLAKTLPICIHLHSFAPYAGDFEISANTVVSSRSASGLGINRHRSA